MLHSISLNYQSVASSIQKITGYTGKNIDGKLDNISVTEDEDDVIRDISEKAVSDFLSKIGSYKPVYENWVMNIDVPKTFDTGATELLSKEIENFIVNASCSMWFHIAREEADTKKYLELSGNNLLNIQRLLCRRIKPI